MVKSSMAGKGKHKNANRGEGGSPSVQRSALKDQSRLSDNVVKGVSLAREHSIERSAFHEKRRNLVAHTSETSQVDGGNGVLEASAGLTPSSPEDSGGIVGSAPSSPKVDGVITGSSLPMVSPAHSSRGDGEDASPRVEVSSPKVASPNAWAQGSPKSQPDYQRAVPAFRDPNAETKAEITAFDLSHAFIQIRKSSTKNVDGTITRGYYVDLKKSDMFKRVTPRIFKFFDGVCMVYLTFADDISDEDAKHITGEIETQIMKSKYANSLPLFRGIDTAGQITTTSRNKIESVFYFSGKHTPDDLIEVIKKIISNNGALLAILGCSASRPMRSQLQLTDCLGVTESELVRGAAKFSRSQSGFRFKPIWHMASVDTPNSEILTCNDCFLTITHLEDDIFPESFEAPTMSGDVLKTVRVKKVFEYTNPRARVVYSGTEDSAPVAPSISTKGSVLFSASSENELFKTRICRQISPCPYGASCLFAHGTAELRARPLNEYAGAASNTITLPVENLMPRIGFPPALNNVAIPSINLETNTTPTNTSVSSSSAIITQPTETILPSMTHSTQSEEIILDESPPIPSTPFRLSALKPGETRSPKVRGDLKRSLEVRSADSTPISAGLTAAAQQSTPVSLNASPVTSPQTASAKLSNANAAVAKARAADAAAEQAKPYISLDSFLVRLHILRSILTSHFFH